MTAGRSRVDAATVRRRLTPAAADAAVGRLGEVPAEVLHPDGLAGALGRLRKVRNRLEAVETSWLTQVRNRNVHRDEGASSASKWAAEQPLGSAPPGCTVGCSGVFSQPEPGTADEVVHSLVDDVFDMSRRSAIIRTYVRLGERQAV